MQMNWLDEETSAPFFMQVSSAMHRTGVNSKGCAVTCLKGNPTMGCQKKVGNNDLPQGALATQYTPP